MELGVDLNDPNIIYRQKLSIAGSPETTFIPSEIFRFQFLGKSYFLFNIIL